MSSGIDTHAMAASSHFSQYDHTTETVPEYATTGGHLTTYCRRTVIISSQHRPGTSPHFTLAAMIWTRSKMAFESRGNMLAFALARTTAMLRIDIQPDAEATNLAIAGKLMGPWVTELDHCWQKVLSSEPAKPVRLSLIEVSFIDSDGRELLARMRRQGVTLVAAGCLMKAMVEEIEAEVNRTTLRTH
jgi:hypothetical protein